MRPVITSTEGLCVANSICIPAALAFWAILAISCSAVLPTIIIRSANSSTAKIILGRFSKSGASDSSSSSSSFFQSGSFIGVPELIASETFLL